MNEKKQIYPLEDKFAIERSDAHEHAVDTDSLLEHAKQLKQKIGEKHSSHEAFGSFGISGSIWFLAPSIEEYDW